MGQGVVIENFQAPSYCHYFSDGDQIFLLTTKGGCNMFWENYGQEVFKNMWHAPFFGD
jgi:hypothetical protein